MPRVAIKTWILDRFRNRNRFEKFIILNLPILSCILVREFIGVVALRYRSNYRNFLNPISCIDARFFRAGASVCFNFWEEKRFLGERLRHT